MIPEESVAGTAAPAKGCDVPDESSREAGFRVATFRARAPGRQGPGGQRHPGWLCLGMRHPGRRPFGSASGAEEMKKTEA